MNGAQTVGRWDSLDGGSGMDHTNGRLERHERSGRLGSFVSTGRHSRSSTLFLLKSSRSFLGRSLRTSRKTRHSIAPFLPLLDQPASRPSCAYRHTESHSFANHSRATRVYSRHESAMAGRSCSALLGNSIQDQPVPIRLLQLASLVNALFNIRRPARRLPPMLQLQP